MANAEVLSGGASRRRSRWVRSRDLPWPLWSPWCWPSGPRPAARMRRRLRHTASVLLPRSGLLYSTAAAGVALGLAPGPPVDAVPAAGLVDAAYCASCGN